MMEEAEERRQHDDDYPETRGSVENLLEATPSSSELLNLFAGGQISAGTDVLWDFLTIREIVTLRCVSKSLRKRFEQNFEYLFCRDGRNYVVPYPGACDDIGSQWPVASGNRDM